MIILSLYLECDLLILHGFLFDIYCVWSPLVSVISLDIFVFVKMFGLIVFILYYSC